MPQISFRWRSITPAVFIVARRTRAIATVAFLVAIGTTQAFAQGQRNSGFESTTIAIVKARLAISPEEEIEQGTIVLRDGLIAAAGKDVVVPADAEIIDGASLTVYAGFIDAATSAMLDPNRGTTPSAGRPIDFSRLALAATPPDNRKSLTPEFEAPHGLKTDSNAIDARRRAGFTAVHIVPAGRLAGGWGALLTTSGLPLREALLVAETLPQFQLFAPPGGGYPATLMGGTAHLRQAFLDARRFTQHQRLYEAQTAGVARPPEDPVLRALGRVAETRQPSLFLANGSDDIHRALDFAAEHELPLIVWGGRDAHRCLARLKSSSRGVIAHVNWGNEPPLEPNKPSETLVPILKDPLRVQQDRIDRWKQTVGSLKALRQEKIVFALSSEGLENPADLFKSMRQAIAAGLPRQAALAALTRDSAQLLGVDKRLGTLSPGKLAHLTVLNGAFDDERSKVRFVFVDGQRFEFNKGTEAVPAGAPPAPAANLAGTWIIEIEAADGKVAATLELAHAGNNLSGAFRSAAGDGKVSSGKIDGTKIDLVIAIGAGAQTIELKFSGTTEQAAEGKLSGMLKSAFGAATKWSATRKPASEAAPKNPVALTIENDADPKASANAATPVVELPTELESDRLQRPLATGGNALIKGGTVIPSHGDPLPETSILVRQGKIAAIGRDLAPDEGATVIDATGRFVMAGIIDTHSHIMFADGMGGVNEATVSMVPEVRVKDVVRSNDPSAYRALAGGVTAARLLHGSANVIGGQDAVVKLRFGRESREQIVQGNPQGVKFALGENVKAQSNRFPNTRLGVEATLNRAFLEAVDYRRVWQEYRKATEKPAAGGGATVENSPAPALLAPRRDLRLEALADIVDHQKFIHSHCYRADEILMLLRVTSDLGIRVWSLQHVLEGYKVAPEIVAHGASCSTFSDWWAYKVEAFDATPYNAALLAEAGANTVIKSDDAELIRHLYLEAAKTLRYGGVAPDAALRMVTLNAARELGLDARLGSIEVGKDADLAVFSGHPLNAFSRCEMTLIEGEPYFIRDKQPTAMSQAAVDASARPAPLAFPSAEVRAKQLDLTPSPDRRYAIVGGTVHPVDGADVERGTVLIHGDKIVAVGAAVEVPAGIRTIDATGLHVYPGLIDAGTVLGLIEIGRVRETHDHQEAGLFQPDLRAGVAINPDSELIPVTRAGGVTTALIRPTGGIICGQTSLMKLEGWTVPEMVLSYEVGLQIDWPGGNDNQPRIDQLREFLREGRTYASLKKAAAENKTQPPIRDPRYEALGPYLDGQKRVFIDANSRKEIAESLLFAEQEKLKIVITGAAQAWKLAGELKKRDVPVIVAAVLARPAEEHDPFDSQYANPGRLHEAGVLFAIHSNASSTAGFSASNSRNVPFEAAQAVAYGLPEAEALKAVTLNAARILQAEDRIGSLTAGKLANILICDGSPLQQSTQYKAIFVAGRPFAPESRHTRLYEKYRGRLREVRSRQP
ncbi:MAG: amidohydrolase family protein [Planctomycetia bacterium]|nr:amidohydrolase family protein [Planctomycetia bacterium]